MPAGSWNTILGSSCWLTASYGWRSELSMFSSSTVLVPDVWYSSSMGAILNLLITIMKLSVTGWPAPRWRVGLAFWRCFSCITIAKPVPEHVFWWGEGAEGSSQVSPFEQMESRIYSSQHAEQETLGRCWEPSGSCALPGSQHITEIQSRTRI